MITGFLLFEREFKFARFIFQAKKTSKMAERDAIRSDDAAAARSSSSSSSVLRCARSLSCGA